MKYLGIDYGKKKIGLAYSEGELASPGEVIAISGLKDAVEKVKKNVEDKEIKVVVIVMPESGESRDITDKFVKAIKNVMLEQEIVPAEETLSTQRGQEIMATLGVPKGKRKSDDAYAAAQILQEYLDGR